MESMRAAVADRPGPPDVLTVRTVPVPVVRPGWVLVRVRAFGLNRSELMTRQGHSPGVRFPRILGIECVGTVEDPSDSGLATGTPVAAVMGEMGRAFDGGYAEFALLPSPLLIALPERLPTWDVLAALPETYLTAHGSLAALGAGADAAPAGRALLVRGGSSSVGLAALSLAGGRGIATMATTRVPAKADALRAAGADHVVIDDDLPAGVRAIWPDGPDWILELVGADTVLESLQLAKSGGTVCATGMLSGRWAVHEFEPVADIPSGTKLTAFQSADIAGQAGARALHEIIGGVLDGRYRANIDRVFALDEIAVAHSYMEGNRAVGKIVVTT